MAPTLHESLQQSGEDVGAVHHDPLVAGRRVDALPVGDRPLEQVGKFLLCPQKIGSYEVDHAPGTAMQNALIFMRPTMSP